MPNTDENGARMIANKLIESVRDCGIPHETSEAADFVTISVGVTSGAVNYTQSGEDYVKRADEMLYKSKENGRNRYTYGNL